MSRKVLVVTGTRADYGLLRWLLEGINNSPILSLELLVTGMHLSEKFGNTWQSIAADGFDINHRVEMLAEDDSALAMAVSTGLGLAKFARIIETTKPDVTVILGDRFEALAAAQASYLVGVPIAHIAGGEITEGALDDAMRHAITKFSSLHFVAAEQYKHRVIQLGESPSTVFNVGAIGLDNFQRIDRLDKTELSSLINLDITNSDFALCTLHPETSLDIEPTIFVTPLLEAIEKTPEVKFVITASNADAGGRETNALLEKFAADHSDQVSFVANLGQVGYISALEEAKFVIGNSSSGILEAPTAGTPTVNIGDRQKGRLRAQSIIDVPNNEEDIVTAISKAISEPMQSIATQKVSPFGNPGASDQIVQVLENFELSTLIPKQFFDVEIGSTL